MTDYSPREIVSELDRFIVGQKAAKRAVAIALRNRWRRQQLPDSLRDEVGPKNILMIGPTGLLAMGILIAGDPENYTSQDHILNTMMFV